MGKTIQVASDREYDQSKTVMPIEYAQGIFMRNVPSLRALKLMHLMIAKAGSRMGESVGHEMRLSEIRNIEGMAHHDRESLKPLFEELRAAVITYDEPEEMRYTVGGLLDNAVVDYRHETSGDTVIRWYFGRLFIDMAEKSDHWAIIDRQTVFSLNSKYSMLLFQHIASLSKLKHIHSKIFTIPELRALLGISAGKLSRFANFNAWALQPAIAEINQLSRFTLKATLEKVGRTVTAVTITWHIKDDTSPVERELDSASVGRKARREGRVESIVGLVESLLQSDTDSAVSFPNIGSIRFGRWQEIALEELPSPARDTDAVADDFRVWCKTKSIPFDGKNIEKTFRTFCKKQSPVR